VTKAARVRVEILDARACPALSALEVHTTAAGAGTVKPGAAAIAPASAPSVPASAPTAPASAK
jgi:hypothetical protein